MGNCVCMRKETASSWRRSRALDDEGEELLDETRSVTSSFSGERKEIKIRMTKKDLEDLMRRINMKGLTAQEILSKLLIDGGDHLRPSNQRSWRPALQSIPELD